MPAIGHAGGGKTAVVLVSGGMDSCVTAAEAAAAGYRLAFLHVNYGQRTQRRELRAFNEIADHYGVPARLRLVCDLPHIKEIGGSSLTDAAIPVPRAELGSGGIPSTYVPFRNAHFLCIAVSWGEVMGAEAIFIGAVEEDSSGYPDCREGYFRVFNELIEIGTRPGTRIRVVTPLIHRSKAEIVRRGRDLGAPLELSWSCYKNEDVACGECESCLLRLRGFAAAGLDDPIPYAVRPGSP